MLPCKKRRTTVAESPQHQGNQEEEDLDLESAVKSSSDQVKDLGSASLSGGPSHGRAAGLQVESVQDAGNQLGVEDPSLSSRVLTQDTNTPVLEAVDAAISQGITLPSLESSQPLNVHIGKGKAQATGSRRGKKITLRPGLVPQEDRGDHPITKEPFSGEPCEEVKEEGGKPQLHPGGAMPSLPLGSHSAKPGAQPGKSPQPDVCACPQEKPLGTLALQAEDETEDGGLFIPMEEQGGEESEKRRRKRKGTKRKRDSRGTEGGAWACGLKLDDALDRTLEDGAKQHNLTAVNVRNILHEVITNEHVVAMMKAAISETEDMPMFEPKMTRSKLKEVVEKGVVIPTWNISPIKKANEIKPPQFVDIQLEDDDSSDEEYQPDDEEEDETAEEVSGSLSLLESDVESTASSPRGAKKSRLRQCSEMTETDEEGGMLSEAEKVTTPAVRHISAEVVPMGPPPPPKPKQTRDSTFMEKLHAVDEELASSPVCMDSFQPMDDSLIAFRTRSKMPLKDVPLGQLEAELRAPDITPDMYDPNTADDEDWKVWLGGLMNDDVGNEDEADDDDDPEYNFLEDLDEPDTEDFRTDRAVRITKKEVNELMEELFETFQDEMGLSNVEDDGPEEEERAAEPRPSFNTPQALRFEEPLANLLNEQHRTVKEQLEQLKMKKSSGRQQQEVERVKPQPEKVHQTLTLDPAQRGRLQQQMQQHVQLLTQIHLLASSNPSLSSEASTTRIFLKELGTFAQSSVALHQSIPGFQTLFQPCNLLGAMQLIEDFNTHVSIDWSPRKTVKKTADEFPCLPKQVAWILATSKVFMYPELLPVCSLKAKNPQDKIFFTKAEDNLLALGLKHFEGTKFPKLLMSKYLLTGKTAHQLTVRIKNLNMNRAPDNIVKFYKKTKQLPVLLKCCEEIQPHQWKPPVEREEHRLPFWLKASLPSIQEELWRIADGARGVGSVTGAAEVSSEPGLGKGSSELGSETPYPLLLPKGVVLKLKPVASCFSRRAWRQKRPSVLKPLLIRPSPSLQPSSTSGKTPARSTQSEAPPSKMVVRIPHVIQPATVLQTVPGVPPLGVTGGESFESPKALPPTPSEARTSFPLSEPQTLLSSAPVPKVMLPSLAPSKFRKPSAKPRASKRKGAKASLCLEPASLLHPVPVIFTVPATTVKVVSLGSGCNVIQPVSAAVAQAPQTIPITTLLVNPTSFPCPLNQPLVASSIPPLIVSSNSVSLPVPSTPEDKAQVNVDVGCPLAEGKNAFQGLEPKLEPQELSPLCAPIFPKEEHSPGPPAADRVCQEERPENSACGWTLVKAEDGRQALEPLPAGDLQEMVKMEPQDPGEDDASGSPGQDTCEDIREEHSVGVDAGFPGEELSGPGELRRQPAFQQEDERSEPARTSSASREPGDEGDSGDVSRGSPKITSSCAGPEVVRSSPPGKCEDLASADGQALGTPAGPEAGGEKDGPEEEEEEDFDDLTQDEEDEMSSASEESVLSVPELQETMEKLTWLASERRAGQEGESEEENSQEENSEPEEEEEEEAEGMESLQKEDEMTDEAVGDPAEKPPATFASPRTTPEAEASSAPPGESGRAAGKGRGSQRARSRRGSRARASKDTSKLLLLYDEDILERDPLREQKDLAFAQAYLTRVREALQHIPGKYEDFLQVIYEFESSTQRQTAVDLYRSLQALLQDWPQLLKDFAAFLLPEQALACGLFEEQQAFEKSRKFLRQLEICFAENPSHHQKIIKVLQSCADCLPQEITELKTQMWQLLKGHDHLQDEFSVFFDHLRPAASRMGDFEEINWTEEKEYEFDGFEEVALPDVEEEDEPPKIPTASKSKRRKEIGVQNHDKEAEWPDGAKDCACACHEGGPDSRLKKSKRRSCGHCGGRVCDGKPYKSKEPQELAGSSPQREASPGPAAKEAGQGKDLLEEEATEERESTEAAQGQPGGSAGSGGMSIPGLAVGSTPLSPQEVTLTDRLVLGGPRPSSLETPQLSSRTGAALCTVRRSQAAHEVLSCPQASPGQQKEGEDQEAVGEPEASMPAWEASGTEKWPGTVEPSPSFLSPVSSRTRDVGRRQVSERSDTPESWLLAGRAAVKTANRMSPVRESSSSGFDTSETSSKVPRGVLAKDSGTQGKGPVGEPHPKATEATVCANNSKVSSTGEKVVLWTREADRVILTMCQERGAQPQTFSSISQQLGNKTPAEVSHRFRELVQLFHTACEASSEEEDDATSTSNTDQLSDRGDLLSEEELDG
ncbi:GON-4-like protein isoform X5 [Ailuropoda melanoleuca]|uniref:GON-4-like protein isoform X5 n=1 Tax=Ailuropoda melanoleuca TaxID=9646 RepID=UPI001494F975|nr:GON-4-like protein isoform X5 [Ailuropoda melanoleuca]